MSTSVQVPGTPTAEGGEETQKQHNNKSKLESKPALVPSPELEPEVQLVDGDPEDEELLGEDMNPTLLKSTSKNGILVGEKKNNGDLNDYDSNNKSSNSNNDSNNDKDDSTNTDILDIIQKVDTNTIIPDRKLPQTITGYFFLKCKLAFRRSPKKKQLMVISTTTTTSTVTGATVSTNTTSDIVTESDFHKKHPMAGSATTTTSTSADAGAGTGTDTTPTTTITSTSTSTEITTTTTTTTRPLTEEEKEAITRTEEDEEAYATFTYLALLTALYLPLLLFFWVRRSMFGAASLVRSLFLGHLLRLLLAFLLLPPSTTQSFIPTWLHNLSLQLSSNLESYQIEQKLYNRIPTWILIIMDLVLGKDSIAMGRSMNPNSTLGRYVMAFEKNRWPPPALIGLALFTFLAILVHPDGLTWIICRQIRDGIYTTVSNTIDGIQQFRAGKIQIKLSMVSGTLATIFLIVIILQQIFFPSEDGNGTSHGSRGTVNHGKSSTATGGKNKHKHRKGKKGKGGRHGNHHHHNAGSGGKGRIKGSSSVPSQSTKSRSRSPSPIGRDESDVDTIISGVSDVHTNTIPSNTVTTPTTNTMEKGGRSRDMSTTLDSTTSCNETLKSSPSRVKNDRDKCEKGFPMGNTQSSSHAHASTTDSYRLQTHKEDERSIDSTPTLFSNTTSASSLEKAGQDLTPGATSGNSKGRGRRKKRGLKQKSTKVQADKRNDEDEMVAVDPPPVASNDVLKLSKVMQQQQQQHQQHPKQKKKKPSRKEKAERQAYSTPYTSQPSSSLKDNEEDSIPASSTRSITPDLNYLNHSYVKEVVEESDAASYQTESTVGLHDQPSHLSLEQPSQLSLDHSQNASNLSPLSSNNGNHSLFSSPLTLGAASSSSTPAVASNIPSVHRMQYNVPVSNSNTVSYSDDHQQQFHTSGKADLATFLSRVGIVGTVCTNLLMDLADLDALERFTNEDYRLYSIHPTKQAEIVALLRDRRQRQYLRRQYYEEQQQREKANALGSWNQGGIIRPPPGLAMSQGRDTTAAVGSSPSQNANVYKNENMTIHHEQALPSSNMSNMYTEEKKVLHNEHSVPSLSSSNYSAYSDLSSSAFVRDSSFKNDPYYTLGSMPQCQDSRSSHGGGGSNFAVGGATSNFGQSEIPQSKTRMSSLPSISHNRAPGGRTSSTSRAPANMMGSNARGAFSNRAVGDNDAEIEADLQELGGQMAGSILDF